MEKTNSDMKIVRVTNPVWYVQDGTGWIFGGQFPDARRGAQVRPQMEIRRMVSPRARAGKNDMIDNTVAFYIRGGAFLTTRSSGNHRIHSTKMNTTQNQNHRVDCFGGGRHHGGRR